MQGLGKLAADEKLMAKQYRLEEYFKSNGNYVSWVVSVVKIMDEKLRVTQYDWSMNGFMQFAKELLEHNDHFFAHVNNLHAKKFGGSNIPSEEWRRLCEVGSKIIVYAGCYLVTQK